MHSANTATDLYSRRDFLHTSAGLVTGLPLLGTLSAQDNEAPPILLGLMPARPTGSSVLLSGLNGQRPAKARLEYKSVSETEWSALPESKELSVLAPIRFEVTGLRPGEAYDYRLLYKTDLEESFSERDNGRFHTQRLTPGNYSAVLITDPHVGTFSEGSQPLATLDRVIENAKAEPADFALALGDNVAWPGSREIPQETPNGALNAYYMYRRHIAPLTDGCAHFSIIGNWAGESGKFPQESVDMVGAARRALAPNPNHETYPQGGAENEDYYAFSWGGVLYIMLNIQTYSKPSDPNALASPLDDVNSVDDWTIGEAQMTWFVKTLENATEPYRFVCMHHVAGGAAGDAHNTLYGRGGARGHDVGEQATIHELMKKHGVQIFFYGHDHVFVDDVVDGIHYALPGSCGAPWKFTQEETGYERFWPDSGHALLEVTSEKATVTFKNLNGDAFHSFSVEPA